MALLLGKGNIAWNRASLTDLCGEAGAGQIMPSAPPLAPHLANNFFHPTPNNWALLSCVIH